VYEILTSRNVGLLSQNEQESLRKLKVGIAGCGMGSFIAESLARLGVGKVIIADPDKVEISNLNRQSFYISEVNQNKALTVQQHLRMINPEIDVIAWPEAITAQNIPEFVRKCDIIIDGIDPLPGIHISRQLAQECSNVGKPFLYPIDIGWGALSLSFGFNEIKFEDVVKEGSNTELLNNLVRFIQSNIDLPPYAIEIWEKLQRNELSNWPQPITATLTASILVATIIVKIIKREPVPFLIYLDPSLNTFVLK
jgi:molybdopterin/thiamine biosynthesis adenylyltransferase